MTSEQPGTSHGTRRRPAWAVGSVAAAVLLTGGGTAYWAATAHGDGGRSVTAGRSAVTERSADRSAQPPAAPRTEPGPGIAPGEPDPAGGGVTYRAEVPLPAAPGDAPSFAASGEVTGAEVARLAAVLGITGAPRLTGDVWLVGEAADGAGPRLTVTLKAPGTWTFTRFTTGTGDCVRGKDVCGPATLPGAGKESGGSGTGGGPPVSEEAARAAAAPVLKALGQGAAKQDARLVQGAVRVVTADPVIGGLPTRGWSTTVSVGADAQVVAGGGELKEPVRTAERPVVGAVEALARLNAASARPADGAGPGTGACATPVPLGADAPAGTATDTSVCAARPEPVKSPRTETVRGAVLGLAPGTVDGARGLVPAWLFQVAGAGGGPDRTVVQSAVAGEGAAPPAQGRTVPGFSYAEADRKLTVNFWGGLCSSYAVEAREESGSVLVKITDTPDKPGQSCVALAQEMSRTVTLRQPLGERKVVDATTGKPLPRQ
ncbi:hypothetical protein [Streptomyces sp. NPDC051567]|uniref:hypothetical protein n=1 Tax=Streptomyces sp. NPDC051567 TaxID=3365660 RepID=UPI00379B8023